MKNVAILISGCGVFDGAEIHETVLTMLAVATAGAKYQCFAPDIAQLHVVDHLSGEVDPSQTRNVLVEAARIARGDVKSTVELRIEDFDALLIPGGFGAAKNLCNFATNNHECEVNSQVEAFISEFKLTAKPVGFICISPVMIPKLYGQGVIGTVGNDFDVAQAFNLMGGEHHNAAVDEIVIDHHHKVVSTPAYMLAGSILEAKEGIDKLVKQVLTMC